MSAGSKSGIVVVNLFYQIELVFVGKFDPFSEILAVLIRKAYNYI